MPTTVSDISILGPQLVGGTVRGCLVGVALLEEKCHFEVGFVSFQVGSVQDVTVQPLLPLCLFAATLPCCGGDGDLAQTSLS